MIRIHSVQVTKYATGNIAVSAALWRYETRLHGKQLSSAAIGMSLCIHAANHRRTHEAPNSGGRGVGGDVMNPLCIYHGNCADGFGAAWVFKRFADREFDFHAGVYQDEPPDVDGREVYLVDFSYKRTVVESMLDRARSITLIDHHKSALEDLGPLIDLGLINSYSRIERSGAMLAWEYFHPDLRVPPPLLLHIEDRDLWKFQLVGTREIQANVFSYPYDFAVWDQLMARPVQELIAEGAAIERKHFKDIDELTQVVTRPMKIGGHVVPMANLPYILTSDAGHLLSKDMPFAGCYWDTPGGRVFSLRSQDDGLDVSEIAKQYGGGGHAHSSGFRVSYDNLAQFEVAA